MADTYLCHQCKNIFKLPTTGSIKPEKKEVRCPRCQSSQTERLPYWAPAGYDMYQGPPIWEYECQHCQHVFKRPAPGSPSQKKEVRCPKCGGDHIHNLTISDIFQPLCGG